MVFALRLTQIVLMNFIIYSYHGSKYGQRSGYNCIGAVDPQISGTKYLELTRYKKKSGTMWYEPLLTNHCV